MIRPIVHGTTLERDRVVPEEMRAPYESLLQRLALLGGTPSVLGVTSCASGEGVSTVAVSLAATAASFGHGPVLLIDANLERPAVHRRLGVKPCPGLAEILADRTRPASLQPSSVANLVVLAAGGTEDRPTCSWPIAALGEIFQMFKKEFVLIVVDLPPTAGAGYVTPLTAVMDGILLVVEAERICREVVHRQKELLAQANARLLGVVVNKQRRHIPAALDRFL
jgi:capsular exopolysaccharide synthesis family protein